MKFNEQQQAAVDCRDHAIVAAGAGAGKTSVLVARYLDLIEGEDCSVENILCLTFTRKAAGEMYERIYRELGSEGAGSRQKREYGRFDKARITTIDAFCSSLIRNNLGDYGFPPGFRIADQAFLRELRDFSLAFLAGRKNDRVLGRLYEHFSFSQLVDGLLMPLAEGYVSHSRTPADGAAKMSALMIDVLNSGLAGLQSNLSLIDEAMGISRNRKSMSDKNGFALDALDEALDYYREAELPLHRPGGEDRPESDVPGTSDPAGTPASGQEEDEVPPEIANLLEAILIIRNSLSTLGRLTEWKEIKEALVVDLGTVAIPALLVLAEENFYRKYYRIVEEFSSSVLEFKRQRAVLYYRDLLDIAIDILYRHPELADYYRNEIRFIMIDEFQDNNARQKELLYLLAARPGFRGDEIPPAAELRPGTLFFVGDEKQSIYRFRGADVRVFKALSGELSAELPDSSVSLHLDTNYRSLPPLIGFFNDFFPPVMGGGESYAAEYRPLEAGVRVDPGVPDTSRVELMLIPGVDGEYSSGEHLEPSAAEALAIAERIRSLVDEGQQLYDRDSGGLRPVEYSDIAVIFPSTVLQKDLETMFRRFAIPYLSDSTRTLFLDASAHDVYSFFKLCLYPADRLSLAAVLRSPIIRLGDDSIVDILQRVDELMAADEHAFGRDAAALPGLDALGEISGMDEADRRDYQHIRELAIHIRSMMDSELHSSVLAEFWRASGYEEFMDSDAHRRAFRRYYDYLLELFELHGDRSMTELVEILGSHLGSAERMDDLELYQGEGSAVSMMTVHKSKGLEFPVVFLASSNARPRPGKEMGDPYVLTDDGSLLLYGGISESLYRRFFSDDGKIDKGLRNPLVMARKQSDLMQANAELRRQLYVACTRAKQMLFISASGLVNVKNEGEPSGSEPSRTGRERFFDLIEAALKVGRNDLLAPEEKSVGIIRLGDGFPVHFRRYDHRDAEDARRHRGSAGSAGTEDLSGPPPALSLTRMLRRRLAATAVQEAGGEQSSTDTASPADSARPAGTPVGRDAVQPGGGDEGRDAADASAADDGSAAAFGTLVHFMLERAVISLDKRGVFELPAAEMIPEGLLFHRGAELNLSAAREMADGVQETELFGLLELAARRHSELPFLLKSGGRFLSGQIDLLLEMPGGECLIIDYKSGADVHPEEHQLQLDIYRLAARGMGYGELKAGIFDLRRGVISWLDQKYDAAAIQNLAADIET